MDLDGNRPIWLQLVDEFTLRIARNIWVSGSRIPSVRDLSTEMGVNPNTVQRALTELDNMQLSYTERTAGRFVTKDQNIIEAAANKLAATAADTYIKSAQNLGLNTQQATALVEQRWRN